MFSFLSWLNSLSGDMGIDLGTANTLVFLRGKGVVLREPSLVARHVHSKKIVAVGIEAKRMIGRTPANIEVVRPLKGGVIADFETAYQMLSYYIGRVAKKKMFFHPRMVVGVPCGSTSTERRAVIEAGRQAGARDVYLIEEPMAAAIGVKLPISKPVASMLIDIGGGSSDAIVVSLGGIVVSSSLRIAGDALDDAIIEYVKHVYNLNIGEVTAEEIKIQIGSAYEFADERTMNVRGIDMMRGLPRTITLSAAEIREALREPVHQIAGVVMETLEKTPPELAADIYTRGLVMSGGGSLLLGFDRLISEQSHVPVYVARDALSMVAIGAGKVLEELDVMRRVILK